MVYHKALYSALLWFLDYSSPIASLIRFEFRNNFEITAHSYANDTQLYVPFTPGNNKEEVRKKLEDCIDALHVWINRNRLKLNNYHLHGS